MLQSAILFGGMVSMVADNSKNVPEQAAQKDWFSRGKSDALMGHSKQPPETDPEQASQYDLGYGEGSIQQSLAQITTAPDTPIATDE